MRSTASTRPARISLAPGDAASKCNPRSVHAPTSLAKLLMSILANTEIDNALQYFFVGSAAPARGKSPEGKTRQVLQLVPRPAGAGTPLPGGRTGCTSDFLRGVLSDRGKYSLEGAWRWLLPGCAAHHPLANSATSARIPGLYARPGNRRKSFTAAIGRKDLWLSRILPWGFYLSLAVLIAGAAI